MGQQLSCPSFGRWWRCALALLLTVVVACGGDRTAAVLRPELSALLPPPVSIEEALGAGVEAQEWDSTAGPSTQTPPILSRPGEAGFAQYRLDGTDEPSYVEVVLYRLGSEDEAESFWSETPPVVAHQDAAVNPDALVGEPTTEDLQRWSLDVPRGDRRFRWQAICLSSGLETSAREWCSDVRGWVVFCTYAMEVRLFGRRVTDPSEWHPLFEVLADETANAARCQ